MTSVVALIGIVIFFVGLLLSIALHEIGHLVPAKLFGVRVSQWMVGFGPTLWSRRRGETEYGIKWIPLGGYNRMIGMLPPAKGDAPGTLRRTSTGPFQGLVESARGAALEEVRPGDEGRLFYSKPWWQKVIIMAGGPAMNFVLAAILLGIVLIGIGVPTPQPVVSTVARCYIPAAADRTTCQPGDPPSPAAQAGLRPGDRIVAFDGKRVDSWDELSGRIRAAGAGPATLLVQRDGTELTLRTDLVSAERPRADDPARTETVGFLGIDAETARVRQGPAEVGQRMWDFTTLAATALVHIPDRMVKVWHAAFGGEARGADSPVGIVGASRLGGEIASADEPLPDRISMFVGLLASFNLAVGVFNLIPLLPLDGGHIAGALWEGIRKGFARLTRRPDPGYVDVARALPVAYTMAILMISMSVLLIYADIVNPVRLSN
jgi:membrane-associated protease RseP (regulator of RpoE activity)